MSKRSYRLLVVAGVALFLADAAVLARGGISRPGRGGAGWSSSHDVGRRSLYRPKVHFVEPAGRAVTLRGGRVIPLTIGFFVQQGHVREVSVIVNGKKAKTFPIAGNRKRGQLHVDFDLGPWGPGTHKIRLEAAQGRGGMRTVRARQFAGLSVTVR